MSFFRYHDTHGLPIRIVEASKAARPTDESDRHIIKGIMRNMTPSLQVRPTRAQWAMACKAAYPKAFIHTGGHHVAVHLGGDKAERDILFVGYGPDWN